MKTDTLEKCDWCGDLYDINNMGYTHFEDGSCECNYCQISNYLLGKNFCSPECEVHYVVDNGVPIKLTP